MLPDCNDYGPNYCPSGRQLAAVWLSTFALAAAFWPLIAGYQDATRGLLPFDLQASLTAAELQHQLTLLSVQSRYYYGAFAALDFLFPPTLAVAIGLLWLYLARWSGLRLPPALLFLPASSALCDWCENIGYLTTIIGTQNHAAAAAHWALAARDAKQLALLINLAATLALLARSLSRALSRNRARRRVARTRK